MARLWPQERTFQFARSIDTQTSCVEKIARCAFTNQVYWRTKQVFGQPRSLTVNTVLPAFAAERLARALSTLLLRSCNRTGGQTDRRTDRRTPYRYIDPVQHTMWAVPITYQICYVPVSRHVFCLEVQVGGRWRLMPNSHHPPDTKHGAVCVVSCPAVCRYNWHSAGSSSWPFPMLKY